MLNQGRFRNAEIPSFASYDDLFNNFHIQELPYIRSMSCNSFVSITGLYIA
jgi:hypothetical protein